MAICQVVTADRNFNAVANAGYQQAFVGFWKVFLKRNRPSVDESTGYLRYDVTAVAVCYVGYATELTYIQELADTILLAAPLEFEARPFLQSSGTYEDGVPAITADGVSVVDAAVTSGSLNEKQTVNVDITLNIPLFFQVEELDF